MRIIAGRCRGLVLAAPKDLRVRPTGDRVKESVFGILGRALLGAQVLDLYAGSGSLGLESYSRGAARITFVDNSRASLALVGRNVARCQAQEQCRLLLAPALKALERFHQQGELFQLVFADPPYNQGQVAAILGALEAWPCLAPEGCLVLERSAHEALPPLPPGLELAREARYGETVVDFIKNSGKKKG